MPHVQFVCPHCEKQSEVQVASVTRSRACPNCGYNVLLQVSGKVKKTARKALLVAVSNDDPASAHKAEHMPGTPAYLPQPLEGDVMERMRMDPEIAAIRNQLVMGLAVLGMAILAAVAWHFVPDSRGSAAVERPAAPLVRSPAVRPSPALKPNVIGLRRPDPSPASTERPGGLQFVSAVTTPSSGQFSTASATTGSGAGQEKAEQVRKVLSAFLSAESVETLLSTVAYRGAVENQIREYYVSHSLVPLRATEISPIEDPLLPPGAVAMQVTLSSGRRIQANVLSMDDRHMGVDWASFLALADMEWSQFVTSKPTNSATFRVFAELGDWYDNEFHDFNKLRCFKITSPADPTGTPFFAYTERFGPAGKALESMLQGRSTAVPVTLRLKFPRDVKAENQGWIESLTASSWVIVPETKTAQVRH